MKALCYLLLSVLISPAALGSGDNETEFFHQAGDKVHILQLEYDYLSLDFNGTTSSTITEIKLKDANILVEYEYGLLPMLSIFAKLGILNEEVSSGTVGSAATTVKTSGISDLYLGAKGFHAFSSIFNLRYGAELLIPWADREKDSSNNFNGHGGKTDLEAYLGADYMVVPSVRLGGRVMTSLYSTKRSTKVTSTGTTSEDEPGHALIMSLFVESPMDALLWGVAYVNEHAGEGKNSAGTVDTSAQTIQKLEAYANIHAGNNFSIAPKLSYLMFHREKLGTTTFDDATGFAANIKARFYF